MNAIPASLLRFLRNTGFSLVLLFPSAASAAAVGDPSSAWQNLGLSFDFLSDQQTGQSAGDIVGVGIDYGFFTTFNPGNSPTNGEIGFRVRMDEAGGNNNNIEFGRVLWVGVDADLNGSIDAFFGVNNQGNSAELTIRDAGTGANTSPNTTTISNTSSFTYSFTSSNYNYRAVNNLDGGTGNLDLTPGGGDTDYYVSFLIPFQDVVTFLQSQGIPVNSGTAIRYIVGTSTQTNSLNQDLGGVNGGINSSTTWEELGGFGPVITFSGTIIPEPDIAALLGAFGLILLIRRRR